MRHTVALPSCSPTCDHAHGAYPHILHRSVCVRVSVHPSVCRLCPWARALPCHEGHCLWRGTLPREGRGRASLSDIYIKPRLYLDRKRYEWQKSTSVCILEDESTQRPPRYTPPARPPLPTPSFPPSPPLPSLLELFILYLSFPLYTPPLPRIPCLHNSRDHRSCLSVAT